MARTGKDPTPYSDMIDSRPFSPRIVRTGVNPDFTPKPAKKPPNGHSHHDGIGPALNAAFNYDFDFTME